MIMPRRLCVQNAWNIHALTCFQGNYWWIFATIDSKHLQQWLLTMFGHDKSLFWGVNHEIIYRYLYYIIWFHMLYKRSLCSDGIYSEVVEPTWCTQRRAACARIAVSVMYEDGSDGKAQPGNIVGSVVKGRKLNENPKGNKWFESKIGLSYLSQLVNHRYFFKYNVAFQIQVIIPRFASTCSSIECQASPHWDEWWANCERAVLTLGCTSFSESCVDCWSINSSQKMHPHHQKWQRSSNFVGTIRPSVT